MNDQTTKVGSSIDGGASELIAGLAVTPDELRIVCDTVVRLTDIRQRGCKHLCVENFAPEMLRKMLIELVDHKQGMVR
jgi:uncharacterized spore protein YtfJ